MQIIIIGAGQVGTSLAESLVLEQHSVTVIDKDEERLNELQSQYDLRTIHGHGSHPSTLAQAGAENADMVIAVTRDDETNIVACLAAFSLYRIPIKIARIRTSDYFNQENRFFAGENSPIDVFINPSILISKAITHLIETPGALRLFDFMDGEIRLVATKPASGGHFIGQKPEYLQQLFPNLEAKIIAIYRDNQLIPLSNTIDQNDDILFLAKSHHVKEILAKIRPESSRSSKHKRVMIIGGGYIGEQLAQSLENHHQVKIIEQNRTRCEELAQRLRNTLVLHGNGCDATLLKNEDVENTDCFCALSNSDADNIVSSVFSKQLGAKQVITLVNRDAYLSLIISGYIAIDIALSPQQIISSAILKYFRKGKVLQSYSLRRGLAEVLEIIADSGMKNIGSTLGELAIPKGLQIIGIIRNKKLLFPTSDDKIEVNDHLIVFASSKENIAALSNLFASRET